MAAFSSATPDSESTLMPYPDDEVIQLREWGTDRVWRLPDLPEEHRLVCREPPKDHWLIGRAAGCALRLAGTHLLPQHAELFHNHNGRAWRIRGLGNTARLLQDGEPRREFILTPGVEVGIGTTTLIRPGVEVGIGATTLVAESPRSLALRGFCARLLGWGVDRMAAVDHALRAIRLAAAHRAILVVQGEGDLVPVAQALHRRVLGADAPFVLCDRRRLNTPASVRSPANLDQGRDAFEAALGGSLCVRGRRLPRDLPSLIRLAYEPGSRVQIIACLEGDRGDVLLPGPLPIELPALGLRETELPRIIEEYADDALGALYAPTECFTEDDLRWVVEHSARSLPEIEKATLRIVALSLTGSVHRAAERLGMAAVSLARWLNRRTPTTPMRLAGTDEAPTT